MVGRETSEAFSRRRIGLILTILIAGVLFAIWTMVRTDRDMREELLQNARIAMSQVNIDRLMALTGTEADLDSLDYLRIKQQLSNARLAHEKCRFMYIMYQVPDGRVFFYADSEPVGSEDESAAGQRYEEISAEYLRAFDRHYEVVVGPVSDRWGTWISALVPMTDPESGDLIAVFGMDVDADTWRWSLAAVAALPVCLTLALMALAITWIAASQFRKTATVKLADSEKRVRMIYENAPALIDAFDETGRCLLWNERCRETFGWTIDEINEHDEPLALFYPDPAEREEVLKTVASEPDANFRQRSPLTKDGNRLITRWASFRLPDGMVINLGYDITEQKQAEEALRQSEGKYRLLADNASDVIWTMDMGFNFTFVSPSVERVFGYSVEQALANRMEDIMPPESLQIIMFGFQQAVTSGKGEDGTVAPLSFEVQQYRSDGSRFWTEINISLLHQSGSDDYYFQGITHDITESKRIEEALRKSEERLSRYIDAIDESGTALFVVDHDYRVRDMNNMMIEWFGDQRGKICYESVAGSDGPCSYCLLQEVIGSGVVANYQPTTADGRSFDIVATQIQNSDGSVSKLELIRDVTERKLAELEKEKLEEQLRQSAKMEAVGRLAGGVAHDFNNILTVINGYSEMVVGEMNADDSHRPDIEVILESGRRAANLVAQLLAFSRKQIIVPKVIEPNDVLTDSQKMLRRIIGEDIDFGVVLAKSLWRIKADPNQLEQVFVNLAVNARDAMPDGGKLTIRTENVTLDEASSSHIEDIEPGRYVMMSVIDTGCGMDAETLDSIFDPFYSTKEVGKGTGLGLATVYGVMKQNDGFVSVRSEIDVGTTFEIYFPARLETAEEAEADNSADLPRGTETILLVEDEEIVRDLAKSILEKQGYTVIVAGDADEAQEQFAKRAREIDLLLSDVVMPKMNGRKLHEQLLETKPCLNALFMSGYSEDEIAHHGVLDEGMRFIQKPFSITGLARKVREALNDE